MGSPALEAMSPNSTVHRIRKADAIGRLRARSDYYLWFFGLIHVKQLLFFLHFFLLVVSVWFMCVAGADDFTGLGVPGLDGFPPFRLPHENRPNQELDSMYVSTAVTIERPLLYTSRSVVSGLGYFYFISALLGLIVLRAVDGVWHREGVTSRRCASRILLLVPFLLSKLSFGGGLFLWSVRAIRLRFYTINNANSDDSLIFLILESIRLVFLPCAIIWALYLYFIYGCMLGFVFAYRRSRFSLPKNGTGTMNSTSWSFRDRNSNTTKSNERLNIKQGFLTRLSVGNRSWHSYRCNENPTLCSYKKKVEGEDHSLSLLSEEVNVSFASEASENNNMNRSFCAFNSSHRPLDTVHEENESQESAMVSSEAVVGSNVKTRM